jgi:4-hydroxyphenylacetate 3-monooxygenase
MAWDLLGSDFAGRHTQYEKFYGGPPHIMDLYSFFNCPWNERRAAVDQIVKDMGSADDLTARRKSAAE